MIDRVVAFAARHRMFPPSARVGVALSGGADSVCLLHVLREIRHIWNLRLTAIHLNHLLRGAESDSDEEFARDLCASWGIPFIAARVNVATVDDNLEQAARNARRAFFKEQIESSAADRIALAHTRSDQAETVLFRLLRGSYTTGLAGMRPVSREGIVRPLLDIDRVEIERYLRDHDLKWREDSSNRDPRFARNRIRHHLLPQLMEEWNPRLAEALARYATLAREDEDYWREQIEPIAERLLRRQPDGALVLAIADFDALPRAVGRRVLRRAVERVRGDLRRIDFMHLDTVLALLESSEGHNRTQLPGVDVLRSFDRVRFAPPVHAPAERDFQIEAKVPGTVRPPGSASHLSLELIERQTENAHDTLGTDLDWTRVRAAMASADSLVGAVLVLRNWRPGDAYLRAGDQRPCKLKELFQQHRVPLWERRNWPVLALASKIVWSRGFGPAEEFAADSSSRIVLRVAEGM